MSTKTDSTETDPLALAQQAREAGIRSLRESRERHAATIANRQQAETEAEVERQRLESEFAQAEAEASRLEQLKAGREQLAAAAEEYAPLEADADQKVGAVLALPTGVAAAYAAALAAELNRLVAGEKLGAAHRHLCQIDPNHKAPAIRGKRLAAHRADDELAALRQVAYSGDAGIQRVQDQLNRFQGWQEPQYAMVQGVRTRIS